MRTEVNKLLRDAFELKGYNVYNGFVANISNNIVKMPAVWINPIQLTGQTGRTEGELRYGVILYAFEPAINRDSQHIYLDAEKEAVWERLETNVRQALKSIPMNPYCEITDLRISPDEMNLTSSGELSVEARFTITISYCNE